MLKKLVLTGVALVALVAIAAFVVSPAPIGQAISAVFDGNESEDKGSGEPRAVPVDIAALQQQTAESILPTTGDVVAADRVTLTSEVSGRIEEIFIADGEEVTAGDTIIRFDDDSEQAALQAAETALEEAEQAKERIDRLAADDFATEARQEEVTAALSRARSELAAAQVSLNDRTVKTPFAGEVGLVPVSPGAYLQPGAPIAELVTANDLRARFAVPERYGDEIEPGDSVRLIASDGRKIETEIAILSPIVDRTTRSIEAEAGLSAESGLRPGSFVRVEIVLERRSDALFAPQTALLREGQATAVFKIVDGTARRVAVETGVRKGDLIELRADDLAVDDQVVASGLQKVTDGAKVVGREETGGRTEGAS